jgi:DUF438 domain-containing protein
MSELINNSQKRRELLKHMILQLHEGEAPDLVRKRLVELLMNIPYDEVVEVEQELISEGLPEEEVLQFCDIHTMVLDGHIDQSGAKQVPPGHPVDTFKKENRELEKVVNAIDQLLGQVPYIKDGQVKELFHKLQARFNELMDVDKHYKRKEYLLFPFLEKYEITGPPKVMWGKHDEAREKLKASLEILSAPDEINAEEARSAAELVLNPAVRAIPDMIMKEEEILFPMCMDTLTDEDWYAIDQQTMEFGYCLYDPQVSWKPEGFVAGEVVYTNRNIIHLSTGSYDIEELEALFKSLPLDITFVDRDDKVKFFSLGAERIFTRNRAILGRDVRMCHPPSSVHVVEQILSDFKSKKENSAAFWINMQGRFIYIEYFALRGKEGEYLGTVEITQDLTHLRKLEGEQRLLSYSKREN